MKVDDVNEHLEHYFQRFFPSKTIDTQARLIDLGLESIDYIGLAAFLFKTTNKWLDIEKFNTNTKIADLSSYLIEQKKERNLHIKRVKLDAFQRYVYAPQLNGKKTDEGTYIIHHLQLKDPIDVEKMKQAIRDTLNNHFVLNSKIIRLQDDYYFEAVAEPEEVLFEGSFLLPHRDINRLKINVHADRLVDIYLQKKKNNYYLIISFHHIALDGWSYKIIQEEVFRRYAGLYSLEQKKSTVDVNGLSKLYNASINEPSNIDELREIFESVEPTEYNNIDYWFASKLKFSYDSFVLSKKDVDDYARAHHIEGASSSVIFTFMLHQMISQSFGANKLFIYLSLSNRFLPITGIENLAGNMVTGYPIFLNDTQITSQEFAADIEKKLRIYFKHMSYGAASRILLEGNTILNNYVSPIRRPFALMLTYINNTSKLLYGSDSISSDYINWSKSKTNISEKGVGIFWDVHHMGTEFLIDMHCRMRKGFYTPLLHSFLKTYFPNTLAHSMI